MDLQTIFAAGRSANDIISDLQKKPIGIQDKWEAIARDWYPAFHRVNDHAVRRDKVRVNKNGAKEIEPVARIALKLEQLLTNRVNDFTFALPVKRVYGNTDTDQRQAVAKAIEAVLQAADIDAENLRRGIPYFAACECCTVWYTVKRPNDLYGFHSEYKLKCKTYSPMDGAELYPLFDEYDDLIAMSFYYKSRLNDDSEEFFETYTADRRYRWMRGKGSDGWELLSSSTDAEGNEIAGETLQLGKIPAIYLWRPLPVFHGLSPLRDDLEFKLSENSDVIAYNAAPVLKVVGGLVGGSDKGESRRIIRVENGGDVAYVSWDQSTAAFKEYVDRILSLFWMQAQMPDISFESMASLGQIGYDARMTLFTDAHLKVNEESGAWLTFFRREVNVVKAFLKLMNPAWAADIDAVTVESVITPYVQADEANDIKNRMQANGGKAIESQLESIERFGRSDNPQETLERIQAEEASETVARQNAFNLNNQLY